MIVSLGINVVLVIILVTIIYRQRVSKQKTAYNSVPFHPRFDGIWRSAALDWIESEDDERPFSDFVTDTIDVILTSRPQWGS